MARWFPPRVSPRSFFCVVGQPIAHSKSPRIHQAFARQTGRELDYERVEVAPGALAAAVAEFRAAGGTGMNVTVPLKEEALHLAQYPRPRAQAAGAANTLWFEPDGALAADNTDGSGLVRDLECNHALPLAGRRVLLLGAGGAARGAIPALQAAGTGTLTLSNRTAGRARLLAETFAASGSIELLAWGEAPPRPFDLVVNATSAGLSDALPALASAAVGPGTTCYDMSYGERPTPFQHLAWALGAAAALDGLGMLVEQAACAFEIWHGVYPQTTPVIAELRAGLARA